MRTLQTLASGLLLAAVLPPQTPAQTFPTDDAVLRRIWTVATLTAMLVYLASEDPELISRERLPGEFPNCGVAPRAYPGE